MMLTVTQRLTLLSCIDVSYDTEHQTLAVFYDVDCDTEANTAILYDVGYGTERPTLPSCKMLNTTRPSCVMFHEYERERETNSDGKL